MQPHLRRWRPLLGIALVALLLVACGASGSGTANTKATPTPAPTPAPHLSLTTVTQTQSGVDATAADMSATATCPQGTTLVGGGYHLQLANNEQFIYIRSDYPSAANAWTVTESNPQSGGAVTLTTYAYCLTTTNVTLTVTTTSASSPPNGMGVATCPGGTALVGGGFKQPALIGSGWVNASYPANNGWQVTGPAQQNGVNPFTIYALCASHPLTDQSIATATTAIANNTVGEADATCPQADYLIGGGFSKTNGALYIGEDDRASGGFTQWIVKALNLYEQPVVGGGGPTPTPPAPMQTVAYAICAAFH